MNRASLGSVLLSRAPSVQQAAQVGESPDAGTGCFPGRTESDEPERVDRGAPARRRRDPRGPGLAGGHRPVPRGGRDDRRAGTGWDRSHRGADHVCCAWRWSLVARSLGVGVPLRTAVAAYYRSQLLNTVLPGGVLGDVHRGIRHGREVGAAGRGIRAVAWERSAGQLVQVMIVLAVLLVLPSPVRAYVPALATGAVAAALGLVLVGRRLSRGGSLRARALRTAAADLRGGLLTGGHCSAQRSPPPWWWPATRRPS